MPAPTRRTRPDAVHIGASLRIFLEPARELAQLGVSLFQLGTRVSGATDWPIAVVQRPDCNGASCGSRSG